MIETGLVHIGNELKGLIRPLAVPKRHRDVLSAGCETIHLNLANDLRQVDGTGLQLLKGNPTDLLHLRLSSAEELCSGPHRPGHPSSLDQPQRDSSNEREGNSKAHNHFKVGKSSAVGQRATLVAKFSPRRPDHA